MSNDYLQSSPSRNLIDPIIYNFSDNQPDKASDVHLSTGLSTQNKSSLTPSGAKFYDNNTLSGWTPLITKTMFTDQVPSFNSTPNRFLVTSQANGEYDYSQGLNLTPFLNQNMGIINSNQSVSHLQNITPFHDKTLQLADFFIDSPIKHSSKDLDSGTPSVSRVIGEKNLMQSQKKAVQKRSITQLDTPQRQPHKLSIISKPNEDEDEDDEKEDDELENDQENKVDSGDKKNGVVKKEFFQTPSKGPLKDLSNLAKVSNSLVKPKEFTTPAPRNENSSPSTVIMSSAVRSPENKTNMIINEPQSPTPLKEKFTSKNQESTQRLAPVMGVFSERKTKPVPKNETLRPTPTFSNIGTTGSKNKSQMQAGMNKFQIVFTDVHTLMNNKSKGKKPSSSKQKQSYSELGEIKSEKKVLKASFIDQLESIGIPQVPSKPSSQPSSVYGNHLSQPQSSQSQDHNTSINSSKELSIISGNSSHMNLTTNTDHMSFDMGGLSSTPNSKYLLDKMLEKPSPQSQNMMNQVNYYMQHQFYSMPPPSKQDHQISANQFLQPQPSMMMMSTPQHQNTLNYGNFYHTSTDISPTSNHNDSVSDRHINNFQ